MNDKEILYTAFQCDRCGRNNAIRLSFEVDYVKDEPTVQEIDVCSPCILSMCSSLFNQVEIQRRKAWLESFTKGVIG